MDIITKAIEAKLHANGLNWLRLLDLRFSPKSKSIAAEVFLEGEEKPLTITATYAVEGDSLRILTLETSKRWITEGIQLMLLKQGHCFPLPTGIKGKMVRMFL
jgi:hypothetical protein